MSIKEFAWNYFNKSGSIEAFLLYRQGEECAFADKERSELVRECEGDCNKGDEAGGQR